MNVREVVEDRPGGRLYRGGTVLYTVIFLEKTQWILLIKYVQKKSVVTVLQVRKYVVPGTRKEEVPFSFLVLSRSDRQSCFFHFFFTSPLSSMI